MRANSPVGLAMMHFSLCKPGHTILCTHNLCCLGKTLFHYCTCAGSTGSFCKLCCVCWFMKQQNEEGRKKSKSQWQYFSPLLWKAATIANKLAQLLFSGLPNIFMDMVASPDDWLTKHSINHIRVTSYLPQNLNFTLGALLSFLWKFPQQKQPAIW